MKSILTFLIFSLLLISQQTLSQQSPGLLANFGIEGDVLSGTKINGTFNQQSTHDWFLKPGGGSNIGLGTIDTTNAAVVTAQLAAGLNLSFGRGMRYSRYSTQAGYLLMDAAYARDYYATSSTGPASDKTAYQGGQKNGDDPSAWQTYPLGSSVADKADLIDGYVHFRRDGNIINGTSSSHLIAVFGISTLANNGDRYSDIEFYSSRINYDTITGAFTNPGPAATGGHTAWVFNANGTIRKFGDMTISFAYNSGGVTDISVWLWVARSDYNNLNPRDFDFIPGEFNGSGNGCLYGYAKIQPNPGGSANFNASANIVETSGPNWGTANKAKGAIANGYYYSNYSPGQFGEGGLDLSALGIDPAYIEGGDPCSPVFTRVMFKSRSSSSFTSSLQDFIGPYAFLDAPSAPAAITPPAPLRCNVNTVNLSPATVVTGATYNWTTSNGSILTDPTQPVITVNKTGKYYLSAVIVNGCPVNTDSTTVNADYYKPVATAYTIGILDDNNPSSTVNIWGGDVAASNFATPYGGSAGLNWKWTGPDGYTSTSRNNAVSKIGNYTLEVTETRNGCKDTAVTPVASFRSLPVKITDFTVVKKENNQVKISWKVQDETPFTAELMRSYNGTDFSVIHVELSQKNTESSFYNDNVTERSGENVYYKLRITEKTGAVVYSKILLVSYKNNSSLDIVLSPNPAKNYTVVGVNSNWYGPAMLELLDFTGKILYRKNIVMEKGMNQVMLSELDKLNPGLYVVRVILEHNIQIKKLLIQ